MSTMSCSGSRRRRGRMNEQIKRNRLHQLQHETKHDKMYLKSLNMRIQLREEYLKNVTDEKKIKELRYDINKLKQRKQVVEANIERNKQRVLNKDY